jgi:hypothetical protein
VIGFVLMLMTEVLYSLRKRSRHAGWGRMSRWLQFHIFTGLVGPYMVLLHSSWKFNGLAGVVMLLTVVIVLSGFVGRYIYTAVPRTADGIELETRQLEQMITETQVRLMHWQDSQPKAGSRLIEEMTRMSQPVKSGVLMVISRSFMELSYRLWWWQRHLQMDSVQREQSKQLISLIKERRVLQRQVASLAIARRMLSVWHAIHIPIGVALFTTAFIHSIAALYYATLIR